MKNKHIAIAGAGLVGSLLSIFLAKRGYKVSVFERRADMRKGNADSGRSINLALSTRGIKALDVIGLSQAIRQIAIPMNGRMLHDRTGNLTFLPYGKEGQFINSVSRGDLNIILLNEAERCGVTFFFNHRCLNVEFDKTTLTLDSGNGVSKTLDFDFIIGADGAFSAIRSAMQVTDRFNYSQQYIEHGYKELHIPPSANNNDFQFEKNALHIWPRESFMLIALPNPDKSFTATLFFPFKGHTSFERLTTPETIQSFFKETFPDARALMPTLLDDFKTNPTSSLVTVKCFPWKLKNVLLIGDAAHAIVPFYGQGMNAGFEDCRVLNEMLDEFNDNWELTTDAFQTRRKPNTDAIAQLALDNFIEMRDLVADADFQLRKKIEAKLHALFPDRWIPLYSMVTFNDAIPYEEAYAIGLKQTRIMADVLSAPGIKDNWETLDFQQIVNRLN